MKFLLLGFKPREHCINFKSLLTLFTILFLLILLQLILRSHTKYFAKGSILADSREEAKGLMVITSGQARCEYDDAADRPVGGVQCIVPIIVCSTKGLVVITLGRVRQLKKGAFFL